MLEGERVQNIEKRSKGEEQRVLVGHALDKTWIRWGFRRGQKYQFLQLWRDWEDRYVLWKYWNCDGRQRWGEKFQSRIEGKCDKEVDPPRSVRRRVSAPVALWTVRRSQQPQQIRELYLGYQCQDLSHNQTNRYSGPHSILKRILRLHPGQIKQLVATYTFSRYAADPQQEERERWGI